MRKTIRLSYQRALFKLNVLLSVLNSIYLMRLLVLVLTIAKPLQWHLENLFQVIIPVYKVVSVSNHRRRRIYPTMRCEDWELITNHLIPRAELYAITFPCLHVCNFTGRSVFFLSPVCSSLFTSRGHHVPSWCWPAGSSWVFSTHPSSDVLWSRERKVLSRSRPLGCPTTWNPGLCTAMAGVQKEIQNIVL